MAFSKGKAATTANIHGVASKELPELPCDLEHIGVAGKILCRRGVEALVLREGL